MTEVGSPSASYRDRTWPLSVPTKGEGREESGYSRVYGLGNTCNGAVTEVLGKRICTSLFWCASSSVQSGPLM